jgi:hypothetical protein
LFGIVGEKIANLEEIIASTLNAYSYSWALLPPRL